MQCCSMCCSPQRELSELVEFLCSVGVPERDVPDFVDAIELTGLGRVAALAVLAAASTCCPHTLW